MAQKKTIRIAFASGGIIPAAVLRSDQDRTVAPHEAVTVPAAYGQHLCDDKFAYEVTSTKTGAKAAAEKEAKAEAEKAKAAKLDAAQAALADAETALAKAEDGPARDAAQKLVDDARSAIAALESN